MQQTNNEDWLRREFDRFRSANPFDVLGVDLNADIHEVRRVFLKMVKKYHPNRFARNADQVRSLATEVFLLVQKAYQELTNEEQLSKWRERVWGAKVAHARQGQSSNTRPSPAAQAPKPATETPASAPPQTPSQSSPQSAETKSRPQPSPVDVRKAAPTKTKKERLEEGRALLRRNDVDAAKTIFQKLAAEEPRSKTYRAYLACALALQHRLAERWEPAARELERSLGLVSDLPEALALQSDMENATKGGFFSRMFGKK